MTALTREHEELLRAAQWLRAAFERDARDGEMRANLSHFIEHFSRHEQDETLLLQDFLIHEKAELT